MKLCAVYSSSKKVDTYLYVAKKDDFSNVPEALMKVFGQPRFVLMIPLEKKAHVAQLPKQSFVEKLESEGFYLQMPPKNPSLLDVHREEIGLGKNS